MDAVVQLDGVTVIYGKNQALKNVSAKFAKGAVGLLGPNGAGKSTMLKSLLGFVKPDQGRMTRARPRRRAVAARDPRAHRLHAGERLPHSRHERRVVCRLLRPARGTAGGGRDAARARGALLRRPRRGALPKRRDLLDRHEAAHQAGAGAGPRSRSAVPRRADQRDGPEGARRDARARARPRAQQGRQPDPLVASPARRRIHLRLRRRDGQGAGRDAGADRRAQGARPGRVYELRIKGDLRGFLDVLAQARAWKPMSTDEDVMRVFVPAAVGDHHADLQGRRRASASRCGTSGRASRRSRTCSPRRSAKSSDMPIHDQSYRHYAGGKAAPRPVLDRDRVGRHPHLLQEARVHGADALRAARRSSSAPCRCGSAPTIRRPRSCAPTAETFRQFLEQQGFFVFVITVYVGAGLIANDRRANALQIYLSKPLMRSEYIAGKLAVLFSFLLLVTLRAGDAAAVPAGRVRRQASRSCGTICS